MSLKILCCVESNIQDIHNTTTFKSCHDGNDLTFYQKKVNLQRVGIWNTLNSVMVWFGFLSWFLFVPICMVFTLPLFPTSGPHFGLFFGPGSPLGFGFDLLFFWDVGSTCVVFSLPLFPVQGL